MLVGYFGCGGLITLIHNDNNNIYYTNTDTTTATTNTIYKFGDNYVFYDGGNQISIWRLYCWWVI